MKLVEHPAVYMTAKLGKVCIGGRERWREGEVEGGRGGVCCTSHWTILPQLTIFVSINNFVSINTVS